MQLAERVQSWLQPLRSQAQPEDAFRSLWEKTARADTTRHPFHRAVLTNLDRFVAEAAAAPDMLVEVNGIPTRWDDMPQRYPHIFRRLTPDWMRNFVITEVARVSAVADSTDYLTERSKIRFADGTQETLTIQHRASGLRATFFWNDEEAIGRVLAKSYGIRSIDPDRHWTHEGVQAVNMWEGLGITSRIYQRAADLEPDMRWRVTSLTPQSARMRRRLHRLDPWRYQAARNAEEHPEDACLWCAERDWASMDSTSFATHPAQ
jgi:hypothetical protein